MKLSVEDVIRIHDNCVSMYGGSYGIRDLNEVKSVINNIYLTFGGQELYPELTDKAAFLAFGLIKNHAFIDGNKRVGVATMITFLELNDYPIQATNEEMIDFGLDVATSKMDQEDISKWIIAHKVTASSAKSASQEIKKEDKKENEDSREPGSDEKGVTFE